MLCIYVYVVLYYSILTILILYVNYLLYEHVYIYICILNNILFIPRPKPNLTVRYTSHPTLPLLHPYYSLRYRQKDILPVLMPYIQSSLVEYQQAVSAGGAGEGNHLKKEAVLVAIASLIKVYISCNIY